MARWNKRDIGKVIVYRTEKGLDEKVIIYEANKVIPNRIGCVESPLRLNPEKYPPIESPIFHMGLIKNQEKEGKEYLRKVGDWYFVERVSDDQKKILETIVDIPRKGQDIA